MPLRWLHLQINNAGANYCKKSFTPEGVGALCQVRRTGGLRAGLLQSAPAAGKATGALRSFLRYSITAWSPNPSQINYLGPYALTRELEETLQRSAPARVRLCYQEQHRRPDVCTSAHSSLCLAAPPNLVPCVASQAWPAASYTLFLFPSSSPLRWST